MKKNSRAKIGLKLMTSKTEMVKMDFYHPKNKFGRTGKDVEVYAIHNWNLSETENGTTVLVVESIEAFLAKLFRKSMQRTFENGMTIDLV